MAIDAGERSRVTSRAARWSRLPHALAGTALVAGVGYRLLLLLTNTPPTNSDEATMGLAALHIGQGQEFPIWFYGQAYMGTLEAYLAAPLIALTGPSTLALRLPTLALYAVFALLAWRLTLRLTGDHWYALLVTALLAFGSDRIVKNQLIAGGGYPEMNAAGMALALLAYDLAAGRPRRRLVRWTGWGFLAGLMVWVDPLVLPYVIGTGVVLVAFRWRELTGRAGALLGAGALVGAAPLLLDSLVTGRSPLTAVLAASGAGQSASWAERLSGALVLGPALGMGFCSPGACAGWQLWWSAALPLLLLAAAVIAWRQLRGYRQSAPAPDGSRPLANAITAALSLALVAAAVATLASYATSSAAGRTPVESSRYLSCLLISVPVLLWPVWRVARQRSPRLPGLARAAAIGVLAGTLGTAAVATGTALATVPSYRTAEAQHAELVATLRTLDVRHVYGGYWTCNRLIFASAEEIACAVVNDDLGPGHNRYPAYRRAVDAAASPAWIAPDGSPLAARLDAQVRADALTLRHIPGWRLYLPHR
ncbi:hypothetical protein [Salinispora tropica]|uniref:Glycosyltransferase RgtA/B/C/D-like domain-containing protein n=1 Tax=Salinispora tropica (strain ATCC BAA-916 / DSM 44818 / JCM 13857 / NBRC 105044 / CNB-440) TaxID=369723 RepID=A4XA23_SALTO|nr:hypothetical protein [Salinispora tropica]ABP55763.1 hypothetical protein Strop_3329 [Salinispora tropica CNB-440]